MGEGPPGYNVCTVHTMRMRKPVIKRILASVLLLSAVLSALLWAAVNYLFIPKVVIPELHEYLAVNMAGPLKLTVKDISFHPVRGFLLHDIELSGPVALKENRILRAKLVDIDLALAPLLWKRITVKRFMMYGVDLNIGRDASGVWNFKPLLESDIIKKIRLGEYDFVVNEFRVKKGGIDYADYFNKDNILERRLTNVDLLLIPEGQRYKLVISGGAKDREEEDFRLEMSYDREQAAVDGTAKLNTRHLNEYWDYYLDEIFKPWHLKTEGLNAFLSFSYLDGKFTMKGRYALEKGALTYGDLTIAGDASIVQDLKYVKAAPAENDVTTEVSLSGSSLLTGRNIFLGNGSCEAVITKSEIAIKGLSGEIKRLPVSLSGRFTFPEPHELYLAGRTGKIDNKFYLKLLTDNQCAVDWEGRLKDSYLKLHADIPDLKNLAFDLKARGDIRLPDIGGLIAGTESFKGSMKVSGDIRGEADKPGSLNGKAIVKVEDLAFLESAATSFEFDIGAKNGLFQGAIPPTNFCGGNFHGEIKADVDKLGVELDISQFDISQFVRSRKLEGTKGVISGNAAFITDWTDLPDAIGGGYIKATDCDIKKLPLFLAAEAGIKSVTKDADFQLPVFKRIEGNYEVKDRGLNLKNILCNAAGLNLMLSGRFSFSGKTDLTAGARFFGSSMFKMARQILIPETIGLDLIADCIVVKIEGDWPDLEQRTTVQPIRSLGALFPSVGHGSPDRYILKKLWTNSAGLGYN